MKLNFWQWLGVVLLIVAIGFWVNRRNNERKAAEAGQPVPMAYPADEEPATEPATGPATAPAGAATP